MLEHFLTELYAFEREIEERAASFFDYHALRVDAGHSGPEFDSFCERVRRVFASSLLPARDRNVLTAVDFAFESRVAAILDAVSTGCDAMDDERLRALHERLTSARAARDERVARMPESLERHDIAAHGLTYFAAGAGSEPIVLLNAIGQGLDYWFRLIDALTPRHRVLAFEPRGTIEDQIRDLESVLAHEGAARCVVAGWCTGPKVAVEFASRQPGAVAAMIFLNPTFRCSTTPRELETAYERNSEPLFRALAARPSMAGSVMKSLQASVAGPALDLESDDGDAAEVLATMSLALRPLVAHPFRSEDVIVEYTRQILDFWSYDSLPKAAQMDVPLLVFASELDRVASPEMAKEVARRVAGSRLVLAAAATHYCLYDRAGFVASIIDDFLDDAASVTPPLALHGSAR